MHGWMDGRTDGWIGRCLHGRWVDGWIGWVINGYLLAIVCYFHWVGPLIIKAMRCLRARIFHTLLFPGNAQGEPETTRAQGVLTHLQGKNMRLEDGIPHLS